MMLLTKLREERGWSKSKCGFAAEIHPARVGGFENGRIVPPSNGVELVRLANALGWEGDPADLLKEVD